jgi:lon-related putative ATP-dependent protease
MNRKIKSLDIKFLRNPCDLSHLDFLSTDELDLQTDFLGQKRAIEALDLGITIDSDGFNMYALGPEGVGKRSVIQALLEKEALKKPCPKDICYVYNFKEPRKPKLLLLPKGLGKNLEQDIKSLLEILKVSIPAIFEEKDFNLALKEIQSQAQKEQEEALKNIEDKALKNNIGILRTAQGFVLAPVKNGEPISKEEFDAMPEDEKAKKDKLIEQIHEELAEYLEKIPSLNKALNKKIKELFRYFTMSQVGVLIDDIIKKYQEPEITEYLNRIKLAILESPNDFRKKSEEIPDDFLDRKLNRYLINVLVDNSQTDHAPIIYEDNPNFQNLVGKIDHVSHMGALVTDFTLLRAGALHKASGGYLLLDAHKLLAEPMAYNGLKRALRSKEVKIENIYQLLGFMSAISLEPEPLGLDIKIILIGSRQIYYLLCELDPEFSLLFKIAADFDEEIPRTPENELLFAKLLKNIALKNKLMPLKKDAIALLIEHSSRIAEDGQKLSTHVRQISDLLKEANYYSKALNKSLIDSDDIKKALNAQEERASRSVKIYQEHVSRGLILIDTEKSVIGQINALSYVTLGNQAFGMPTRITASISEGKGDVIDIEREVKLGGPIHSKGVLILSGFLRKILTIKYPLSLTASLVFEQSYGQIEGDSASAAEACLLIASIANIPIKQSLAITGSINQQGEIQAVGGINEKIEGFFDLCKKRGLTGDQGVIIPKSNISHLMLKEEVLEACKNNKFYIYAVEHADEALELLTGVKAQGLNYKNTVYQKALARIKNFSRKK